ncbi:uncharacterized protein srsf10a isoform X3 [Brachyhypopomus gauderio]|uniref:uncharacterized protein srsf10a isoform X3 n=1 Tax=Brachyhypopomus gauderio TaxID=698409 RepID=UPI004042184E
MFGKSTTHDALAQLSGLLGFVVFPEAYACGTEQLAFLWSHPGPSPPAPSQMRSKERRSPRSFSRYDEYERDGRYRRSRSRSYDRRRSRSPSYERRPRRSDSPRDSRSYGRHRRSRSRENDRYRNPREHGRVHRAGASRSRSGSRSPSPDSRFKVKGGRRSQSRSPRPPVEDLPPSTSARGEEEEDEEEAVRARSPSRSGSHSVSRSRSRSRSRSWAGRKSGGH